MKKLLLLAGVISFSADLFAQKAAVKLVFEQGKVFTVNVSSTSTVSQEAMGQAIDFSVNANVQHRFRVTNSTEDNTTLHHDLQRITYDFEGMGQSQKFDSDNPKDLNSQLAAPIKEMLGKSYDMIIDPSGKVLMAKPETIELSKGNDGSALISGLLREQASLVFPPRKNEPSFFKILPETEVGLNEGWVESKIIGEDTTSTSFTLTAITDTTYIIDFKGTANSTTKAEMMGMETVTKMNDHFTGTIIVDKATGVMRQKTTISESNGVTEVMGGVLPVTSKSRTDVIVE